ncbi:AMP-binding protein [Rhizobium sp.]
MNAATHTNIDTERGAVPVTDWGDRRPARSTYQLLSRIWSSSPERVAVTMIPTGNPDDGDISVSRAEMLARVNSAANLFASIGLADGESIATLLPSGADALVVSYGAQTAGIVAPLNPMLGMAELEHLVRLAGARALVASSDPALGIWEKAIELARRIPSLALLSCGPAVDAAEDFAIACARFPSDRLAFTRLIEPSDIAAYIHTGGTTGTPKLARITHDNFLYGAWAQSGTWGFGENDVILSALPLFHVSGLATLATVPLSVGAQVVFLSETGFRNAAIVANFWRIVEKYRGSFSAFVPTIATALAKIPVADSNLASLRTIMIGGAAASAETLRRLKAQVQAEIVVTFGQTECLVGTGTRPGQVFDPMSSGGVPDFMRIAIRDAAGRDLPHGSAGNILLSGPAVFAGYVGRPADDGFTPDGWLKTGDIGWLDEDGMLYVTGRTKDLIIRSGHNIDPRAIEEAGASHPAVASCAAVGAPDRYAGEVPVLYVALNHGAEASPEELLDWVSDHVPERAAAPKQIHILPALPVTTVGKIFKPALRLDAATRVAERALAELIERGTIGRIIARHDDKRGMLIEIEPGAGQDAEAARTAAEAGLAGFVLQVTAAAQDCA